MFEDLRNVNTERTIPTDGQPPIGIKPRYIWQEMCDRQRLKDIKEAMQRYLNANMLFPKEWYDEAVELNTKLKIDMKPKG